MAHLPPFCVSNLQPSSGSSLFGSSSTNTAGPSSGGFFSGLGGKASEDAANKNPFGTTASTGGFGQSTQPGMSYVFFFSKGLQACYIRAKWSQSQTHFLCAQVRPLKQVLILI